MKEMKNMKKIIGLSFVALAAVLLSSCKSKELHVNHINSEEVALVYSSQNWDVIKVGENNFVAIPGPNASTMSFPVMIQFDNVFAFVQEDEMEEADEANEEANEPETEE